MKITKKRIMTTWTVLGVLYFVFYSTVPYVLGEKVTITVKENSKPTGRYGNIDRGFYTYDNNTQKITYVTSTALPRTRHETVRDGYKFGDQIYLIGLTWYMLFPLVVVATGLFLYTVIRTAIWAQMRKADRSSHNPNVKPNVVHPSVPNQKRV